MKNIEKMHDLNNEFDEKIHKKNINDEKLKDESNGKNKLIANEDLNTTQYDENILCFNMERRTITPYNVFKTQKNLSNNFIVEYILNEDYAVFMEDYNITVNTIIGKFPNFANFDLNTYKKK